MLEMRPDQVVSLATVMFIAGGGAGAVVSRVIWSRGEIRRLRRYEQYLRQRFNKKNATQPEVGNNDLLRERFEASRPEIR